MKRYLVFALVLFSSLPVLAGKLPYSYFRVGNSENVSPITIPGIVLMGGGTDVDAAFQWMCSRGGNGDFLVIRATGTDAYNPYIKTLCPSVNSVATLIIPSVTAANHPDVVQKIQNAEVIFIAGGDQSNYINYWKGTPVQVALQSRIDASTPIGGTSAGMNVLTQFVYSAQASKGVTSSQALADPFNRYMSFDRDFVSLPILAGIIGDPHFVTRDRMGRDLAFLCRIYDQQKVPFPRGIAVDEQTALLIDESDIGKIAGAGAAYFLEAPGAPEICKSSTTLTYKDISVYRINGASSSSSSGSFNLSSWSGANGTSYSVSAIMGVLSSTQSDGSPY